MQQRFADEETAYATEEAKLKNTGKWGRCSIIWE